MPIITGPRRPEEVIIGRAAIAHALGKSERTVTRWLKRGLLPAIEKRGPFENSMLAVRAADIERLAMVEEPAT